jgi:hypothetical protein
MCNLLHFYSPTQGLFLFLHNSFTTMSDCLRWLETGRTPYYVLHKNIGFAYKQSQWMILYTIGKTVV